MFEFDSAKSLINKEKHGIDFERATGLWNDPFRIEIQARFVDEARFLLIAILDQKLWSAIYAKRGINIRIISVRRARENEEEIYYGRGT